MSGECDKCGEHCLECGCKNPWSSELIVWSHSTVEKFKEELNAYLDTCDRDYLKTGKFIDELLIKYVKLTYVEKHGMDKR